MSPGRIACPDDHVLRRADHGDHAHRQPERARSRRSPPAPPRRRDMSNFISCMRAAGLDRVAAGVEGHRLADDAQRRAGDVARVVGERDQLRLGVRSARDGGEGAHARRLDRRPVQTSTDRPSVPAASSAPAPPGARASSRWPARWRGRARALAASAPTRAAAARPRDVVVRGDDELPRGRRVRAPRTSRRCRRTRPAACPPPARRRCASSTWWGSSQHSARAPSSRARPSATAAAIRARSGVEGVAGAEPEQDPAPAAGVHVGEWRKPRAPRRSPAAGRARRRRCRGRRPRPRRRRRRRCRRPCRAGPAWWTVSPWRALRLSFGHADDRHPWRRTHPRRASWAAASPPCRARARRDRDPRGARARGRARPTASSTS